MTKLTKNTNFANGYYFAQILELLIFVSVAFVLIESLKNKIWTILHRLDLT